MTNIKETMSILAPETTTKSRVYRSESALQVRARAQFLRQSETGEERAGIDRLKKFIGPGSSFDKKAPRGFYLNIRV